MFRKVASCRLILITPPRLGYGREELALTHQNPCPLMDNDINAVLQEIQFVRGLALYTGASGNRRDPQAAFKAFNV